MGNRMDTPGQWAARIREAEGRPSLDELYIELLAAFHWSREEDGTAFLALLEYCELKRENCRGPRAAKRTRRSGQS